MLDKDTDWFDIRPWGSYLVLFSGIDCKVKRINVNPKSRLSKQYHNHREEIWVGVSGTGTVELMNGPDLTSLEFVPRSRVFIPQGCIHRITNKSKQDPLVFIEVALGDKLDEDDIVRIEDDYERV